jgi:hypothetical protein
LAYIWNTQTFINSDWFISLGKQTLKDQYNHELWHSQTENSTKALTCRLFKDNFMPEPYLEILDSKMPLFYVNIEPLIIDYRLK